MKLFKRMFTVILSVLMAMSCILPAYAADARLNHGININYTFGINDTGYAELAMSYSANPDTFTNIRMESCIQKRSLGFIWTKVENGAYDDTWIDSSTEDGGMFVRGMQLDSTGTYRAVFKVTISGTGAADDVLEEKITDTYE